MQEDFDVRVDVDKPQYDELMQEAEQVLVSLSSRLSNVSVKVGKESGEILHAITRLFGPKYIKSDGTSEITFEMFKQLTDSIRKIGEAKVEEYI